jgi:hypothetical protein
MCSFTDCACDCLCVSMFRGLNSKGESGRVILTSSLLLMSFQARELEPVCVCVCVCMCECV